jgi:sigma-B regulation protein RsbU (phosphoserine phosphatase)
MVISALAELEIDLGIVRTELTLARDVQRNLLPEKPPLVAGIELYGASLPAHNVGGDFYDFALQGDEELAFVVGDVSGKGLSAALLMAISIAAIRNEVNSFGLASPAQLLAKFNNSLYNDFTRVGMFSTVFAGQYVSSMQELIYANAGHSPVIYCPAKGQVQFLTADSTAIGVLPFNNYTDHHLRFNEGDTLIVATDGLSEARSVNDELFGHKRLLCLADEVSRLGADKIAEAMFAAVQKFAVGRPQEDDQTLIVVKAVPARK